MKVSTILIALITLLITSCSAVKLSDRINKDRELNDSNYSQLKGSYSNRSTNYARDSHTILKTLTTDTVKQRRNFMVKIEPLDNESLIVKFYNDSIPKEIKLTGRYKRGYFKVKREWNHKFLVGPLFWGFGDKINYIGLRNNKDLVILNSRGGTAFIFVVPAFSAGGQFNATFKREK